MHVCIHIYTQTVTIGFRSPPKKSLSRLPSADAKVVPSCNSPTGAAFSYVHLVVTEGMSSRDHHMDYIGGFNVVHK